MRSWHLLRNLLELLRGKWSWILPTRSKLVVDVPLGGVLIRKSVLHKLIASMNNWLSYWHGNHRRKGRSTIKSNGISQIRVWMWPLARREVRNHPNRNLSW